MKVRKGIYFNMREQVDRRRDYKQVYYVKNYEKIRTYSRKKRWEHLDSWESYFKDKTVCEICGRSVEFNSGKSATSIHFDHRHGGIAVIKGSPRNWLVHYKRTPENQKIWELCDFGILCTKCNLSIPTKNRKQWLEKVKKYINKIC